MMNKTPQGGARPGAGRKAKYPNWPGPTESIRVPKSAIPAIEKMLEGDHDLDAWSEYNIILDYLHWLSNNKKAVLCEWSEGYDEGGVVIPQGFLRWAGSHQLAFEEYKGEDLEDENVQNQKYRISDAVKRFVDEYLRAGNTLEYYPVNGFNFTPQYYEFIRERWERFCPEDNIKMAINLLIRHAIKRPGFLCDLTKDDRRKGE